MNIILFGFQGSGKTHFGRLLAKKLGRPFIDTDDVLCELYAEEKGQRLSAREIYSELGETGFRALETEAICKLEGVQNAVISLGGGAVLDPMNVEMLLRMGEMIYLDADFEALRHKETAAFAEESSLPEVYRKRKPIYESIPARRIEVGALDEAGVLAALYSIACLENG